VRLHEHPSGGARRTTKQKLDGASPERSARRGRDLTDGRGAPSVSANRECPQRGWGAATPILTVRSDTESITSAFPSKRQSPACSRGRPQQAGALTSAAGRPPTSLSAREEVHGGFRLEPDAGPAGIELCASRVRAHARAGQELRGPERQTRVVIELSAGICAGPRGGSPADFDTPADSCRFAGWG
jgi:hypothetical protein